MYTILIGARHAPRVVVRPNRSLSAAGLVAVCLGLSLYLLALAALFWKTAWTVVPFLFAEMILIGAIAWGCCGGTRVTARHGVCIAR